jgi:predicted dehydrogenase
MALNLAPGADPQDGQHTRYHSETPILPATMFAVPVVLFGCGVWSKKHWLPVLVQLAKWCLVHLTVVDRGRDAPSALAPLIQEGVLDYLSWDRFESATLPGLWKIAFVVTSPEAHLRVIRSLVHRVPTLRIVVCEKPCGEDRSQIRAAVEACRRAGVLLFISDHYLLRPSVQHVLRNPHLLRNIGALVRITVALTEASATGPSQGVIADMAVHLLNVLLILFPGAEFVPATAFVAHAMHNSHTDGETYCFCIGRLLMPSCPSVPCELECGKQLEDKKEVSIIGTHGRVLLNLIANTLTISTHNHSSEEVPLQWNPTWSYGRLVFLTLSSLSTLAPAPSQQT